MSPNNGGYSWTNTSQWSQVPTGPAGATNDMSQQAQNNNTQQAYNQSQTQQPQSSFQQPVLNPAEPRVEMIKRLYRSILGREADTAGLNYYLYNTQIPESQIASEMYSSTEHNELLTKAKDIREMIEKMEANTKKMADMEYQMNNLQVLNDNYKTLIEQKTQIINQLRGNLPYDQQTPEHMHEENEEYVDYVNVTESQDSQTQHYSDQQYSDQPNYQMQEFPEELMLDDPFEDEGYERRGFWGWVRNIFS